MRQIKLYQSIGLIGFVNVQGDFIGLERLDNGVLQIDSVNHKISPNTLKIYHINEQGEREQLTQIIPNFDPRTPPGYQSALQRRKATWSPVFSYTGVPRIAISAVVPFFDDQDNLQGVLITDFLLSLINEFLKEIEVSPRGQTFIMERSGLLIASSALSSPFKINDQNTPQRMQTQNSTDPILKATTQYLETQFGSLLQIKEPQNLDFKF